MDPNSYSSPPPGVNGDSTQYAGAPLNGGGAGIGYDECRYGLTCRRRACRFVHPPGFVPPSTAVAVPPPSTTPGFAPTTSPFSTAGGAPPKKPCRYGAACFDKQCRFEHPQQQQQQHQQQEFHATATGAAAQYDSSAVIAAVQAREAAAAVAASSGVTPGAPGGMAGGPLSPSNNLCRYGADCRRRMCRYIHPAGTYTPAAVTAPALGAPGTLGTAPAPAPTIAASVGGVSLVQQPAATAPLSRGAPIGMCRYGISCHRKSCRYLHPGPQLEAFTAAGLAAPALLPPLPVPGAMMPAPAGVLPPAKACRFGPTCHFRGCRFWHPPGTGPAAATAVGGAAPAAGAAVPTPTGYPAPSYATSAYTAAVAAFSAPPPPSAAFVNATAAAAAATVPASSKPCHYGARCNRPDCKFGHSAPTVGGLPATLPPTAAGATAASAAGIAASLNCRYCGAAHLSSECTVTRCTACNRAGHTADVCRTQLCRACNKPGHKALDCRQTPCRICTMWSHSTRECRNVVCRNCQAKGHRAAACPEPRRATTDSPSEFLSQ